MSEMGGEAAESDVGVGTIVAETYEIVRMLGRGGMGAVWEGHHARLPGKRVAIKVLHASVAEDPESLARFQREAEIACRLGHHNIVEVHDFNKLDNGSPYLILELLEGTSLDERLKEGAISIENCEAYLRQIGSALQCAHAQGVIHRDLKPQNIFLVPSPSGVGPDIIKVLDFGISKIRGSQTIQTQDSTLLGTPQYMAPEQAVGNHVNVDARTDIFALGVMLYELLSGQPPFSGQNIPEVVYKVVHVEEKPLTDLVPGLPQSKADAIHKALAKAQDDRFATIEELVLAFTGVALPVARKSSIERVTTDSQNRALASAATFDSSKIDLAQAATIDSSKIDLAQAATVSSQSTEMPVAVPPSHIDLGAAATIDSSKLDRETLESLGVQPAAAAPASKPAGSRLALAGFALAGVAIAVFAFTRGGSDSGEATQLSEPALAPIAVAAPATDAALAQAITVSDAAATEVIVARVAEVIDAGVAAKPPKGGKTRRPGHGTSPTEPSKALPADVAKLLSEAQDHLKARRIDKVLSLTRVANRTHPTPKGYTLRAAAFCYDGDLPAFNGAVRKLRTLAPVRARAARAACKKFRQ